MSDTTHTELDEQVPEGPEEDHGGLEEEVA